MALVIRLLFHRHPSQGNVRRSSCKIVLRTVLLVEEDNFRLISVDELKDVQIEVVEVEEEGLALYIRDSTTIVGLESRSKSSS